jgi:glycosyltransferase involved in cell wall biosynthesis
MTSAGQRDGAMGVDDSAVIETYGNPDLPEGTPERPLVTFALFAYNQEKYIREAVEGAFSQTYSPLEIILSDDCSSDATFEIMQELARAYEGLHKVFLYKTSNNLGILEHFFARMSVANGQIFVCAAGDDISCPS